MNYVDFIGKANKPFYWEGEEGKYGKERKLTFASRNYPDFIIKKSFSLSHRNYALVCSLLD